MRRARVCWLATEVDDAPPPGPPPAHPPTVLVVGRLEPYRDKGHAALIDGWPTVVSAVPDARLLIVGAGPGLDTVRRRAAASPAAALIEVPGFVPETEMEGAWSRASVFAMPSRGEGFGLVYIEAMRQGLPVIASVHDAAPEINLDGHTGYNVDLDEPGALPERIIHVLRHPAAAARLGANGRSRWYDHFRFSAFRERFRPILTEFLTRH